MDIFIHHPGKLGATGKQIRFLVSANETLGGLRRSILNSGHFDVTDTGMRLTRHDKKKIGFHSKCDELFLRDLGISTGTHLRLCEDAGQGRAFVIQGNHQGDPREVRRGFTRPFLKDQTQENYCMHTGTSTRNEDAFKGYLKTDTTYPVKAEEVILARNEHMKILESKNIAECVLQSEPHMQTKYNYHRMFWEEFVSKDAEVTAMWTMNYDDGIRPRSKRLTAVGDVLVDMAMLAAFSREWDIWFVMYNPSMILTHDRETTYSNLPDGWNLADMVAEVKTKPLEYNNWWGRFTAAIETALRQAGMRPAYRNPLVLYKNECYVMNWDYVHYEDNRWRYGDEGQLIGGMWMGTLTALEALERELDQSLTVYVTGKLPGVTNESTPWVSYAGKSRQRGPRGILERDRPTAERGPNVLIRKEDLARANAIREDGQKRLNWMHLLNEDSRQALSQATGGTEEEDICIITPSMTQARTRSYGYEDTCAATVYWKHGTEKFVKTLYAGKPRLVAFLDTLYRQSGITEVTLTIEAHNSEILTLKYSHGRGDLVGIDMRMHISCTVHPRPNIILRLEKTGNNSLSEVWLVSRRRSHDATRQADEQIR